MQPGSEGNEENSLADVSSFKNGTNSKEDMVFDYFGTSNSSSKLKPHASIEMNTLSSNLPGVEQHLPSYRGRKYANNFSGRVEDPYADENGARSYADHESSPFDCSSIRNGLKLEESPAHSAGSSDYQARSCDEDELQQVVVENPARGYASSAFAAADEGINFFSNKQPFSLDSVSSGRPSSLSDNKTRAGHDSSLVKSENSSGEEGTTGDGSSKGPTSMSTPYLNSNCLTNFIYSIKPNGSNMIVSSMDSSPTSQSVEKTEVEKRMQRRQIRQDNKKKKAPVCRSEDIPEYKGELSVDEIMAFIDDTKAHKGVLVPQRLSKKDEAVSYRQNKMKVLGLDQVESKTAPETSVLDKSGTNQESICLGSREEEPGEADVMQKTKKKRQVVPDAPAAEAASLPTSSSTSSFRTASPPADIPLPICIDSKRARVDVEQAPNSFHSPTAQKEFITVQKKKKLKQQSSSQPFTNKGSYTFEGPLVPVSCGPEQIHPTPDLQNIKSNGTNKTPTTRQMSFKLHGGLLTPNAKTSQTPESSSSRPTNVPEGVCISLKSPFIQKSAATHKKTPSIGSREPASKSDAHFDPSQFPELSGSGRRNSTGSAGPNNLGDASKGFAFSYADIAAKLKQRKHSSEHRRRGSLQLTSDEVCSVMLKSPSVSTEFHEARPPISNSSKNSALCMEFDDCGVFTPCNGTKDSMQTDLPANIPEAPPLPPVDNSKCEFSRASSKTLPRCKEPVVFLDGRQNPQVTDLVFIFDPSIPVEHLSKKPVIMTSASEPTLVTLNKTESTPAEEAETALAPRRKNLQEMLEAAPTSDLSDCSSGQQHYAPEVYGADESYSRTQQLSPGRFHVPHPVHQSSRPTLLSTPHPSSRQVVKVSPMPVVTPVVQVLKSSEKKVKEESKPTVLQFLSLASLSTDAEDSNLVMSIPRSSFIERMSIPRNHSMFDLYKAQMFLYAGFEECVKESKNNPTNVVLYSE